MSGTYQLWVGRQISFFHSRTARDAVLIITGEGSCSVPCQLQQKYNNISISQNSSLFIDVNDKVCIVTLSQAP